MAQTVTEEGMMKFFLIGLIFLFTSFSQTLGILYSIILIANWIYRSTDKNIKIKLEQSSSGRTFDLAIGAGAFFLFIIFIQFIEGTTTTQSALQLLSQSVPILAGNAYLQIISFGLFVATIESVFFFGGFLESISDTFIPSIINRKVNIFDLTDYGAWLSFILVATTFTIVHIQTRTGASVPLFVTFAFGILSCVLVSLSRNLRSATFLHIINNTLAVAVVTAVITI